MIRRFAAVHESGCGTKRTYPTGSRMSAFRVPDLTLGLNDVRCANNGHTAPSGHTGKSFSLACLQPGALQ
jgi:hypothetical protein